jgi:hypothetical protein
MTAKSRLAGLAQNDEAGRLPPQLIINAVAGESTHVVFCLSGRLKISLAGEFKMLPVGEVDMTVPCPCVGAPIFTDRCDEGLVAV